MNSKSYILSQKSGGKVNKPPPFKLKDLPVYSKTLKASDLENRFQSLLGGKYNPLPPVMEESPRRKPIDFSRTPAFKQYVMKNTELDSLMELENDLDIVR